MYSLCLVSFTQKTYFEIHLCHCVYQYSIFTVKKYSTIGIYHNLFLYLPVYGYLYCFPFLTITNKGTMRIYG